VQVHGCDVEKFSQTLDSPRDSFLLRKNVCDLRLKVLGHWWDQDTTSSGHRPPADLHPRDIPRALVEWRKAKLLPTLEAFAAAVAHFECLDFLIVKYSFDWEASMGPQYPFLPPSTVAKLLRNLPMMHSLRMLIVDLSSGLDYSSAEDPHICEELAHITPRLERVKIRLKMICPKVFDFDRSLRCEDVKLKSLVIKMFLPQLDDASVTNSVSCYSSLGEQSPRELSVS
jgi:hypothetical protein